MLLDRRLWFTVVLVGLVGQLAWTVENMYLNVFIFETITDNPSVIATVVAASAVTAAVATLLVGPWSDRVGGRRPFIVGGYLLWGVTTAAFGLVAVGGPIGLSVGAAVVAIVVLDCVMTLFGSSANDAAYQAWITDVTTPEDRGRVDSVVQTLPVIAMLIVFVALDPLTKDGQWITFFAVVGTIVVLAGLAARVLVTDVVAATPHAESFLTSVLHALRPNAVRRYPLLYLTLATWALIGTATQSFMPYLLIYLDHYLHLDAYALVLGGALILASAGTVLGGRLIDRWGKGHLLLPALALFALSLLAFAWARNSLAVLVCGAAVLTGMLLSVAVLTAISRDLTPVDRAGAIQGVRMVLVIMVPMIVGPFIGAAVISGNAEVYVDLGVAKVVPTPAIFGAATILLILAAGPALALRRQVLAGQPTALEERALP